MPYNFSYNPGVQDVSGQLLGQGISQAGQGIASGVKDFQKEQDTTKLLGAQSKAFETIIPIYAQAIGMAPDEVKQTLAQNPEESIRQRAARLATFHEGMIETAKAKQQVSENQARAAQAQLAQQESARMQQQMAQQQRNQSAMNAALNGGITAPDLDRVIKELPAGNRFQGLPAFQPNAADIDAMLGRYTQAGGQIDPSVAELFTRMDATQARREAAKAKGSGMPQLVNLGKRASGEVVEGVLQPTGNFTTLDNPNAQKPTEFGQLLAERDAAKAAGRTDLVGSYDALIKKKVEENNALMQVLGAVLGGKTTTGGTADIPAPPGQAAKRPTTISTQAEYNALPSGTPFIYKGQAGTKP